jgi:thioredoxin 1
MSSFKDIINSDKPVLIDFHADWCGPCKMLAPQIKQVKQQIGDKARILKIDVDKNQQLAASLQVQGVPTLMIYKQGELKWRQSGVVPAHSILSVLNQYI